MAVTKVSSTIHFVSRNSAMGGGGETATGRWTPHTDVYVSDNNLVIKVELAGMKSDSLEIIVEGQRLRISGGAAGLLPGAALQFSGDGNQLRAV